MRAANGCFVRMLPHSRRESTSMEIQIYHNPKCGTSRNTLAMIVASGETPEVNEYLHTPPTRERLVELIARTGRPARARLREKGTPYDERSLGDARLHAE